MTTSGVRRAVLALLAVAIAVVLNGAVNRAADDEKQDPLREELLKLNSITGEDAQRDKLRALVKDKEKAKKLATELLENAGVALIGGPDFGILGEGYIRLSYANSEENILRALERVGALLAQQRPAN